MENEPEPRRSGPVLVPVDFSAASREALVWAAHHARGNGADLVVLHVVHDPAGSPGTYRDAQMSGPEDAILSIGKAAERMMETFLDGFRSEFPDLIAGAKTRLVIGVPTSRILEVADEIDARMIAVGSHGRKGIARMLLGSTAEDLVRDAERPVVIFKAEPKDKKDKKDKKSKKGKKGKGGKEKERKKSGKDKKAKKGK